MTIHPTDISHLGGHLVMLDKGAVAAALRRQGDHDRAQQAECALPRQVDTRRDAGLLHRLDVDLDDLEDPAAAPGPSDSA
ncbi:hypothetical protein KRR39_07120 [Nocardioides panacis]|uniref:Uncharacterized protein n=1 Tax=Nocardioides panacis TaxID=2849501 RepID=A0A975T0Y0_9ACTN|nr:hypothetical protein [Nocardioides panacis]QWZ09521.1 hypothetical protein KRR39_07120 [Nocardioides panacis]